MDLREFIKNQTDVALTLAKHVISTEAKESNFVFSPPLINFILSLIATGSTGPTLNEVLVFLKSTSIDHLNSFSSELVSVVLADGSNNGGPRLSIANGVWVDESISLKPSFKQVADSVYNATSNQTDFQTKAVEVVNEVNLWAEKNTNGLIKEVLPISSVNNWTRLIFANALYFKGDWVEKFDKSKTKKYDFHLLNGRLVRASFMTSKKKQYLKAYDDFKVLRLPCKQGKDKRSFSMYILLPNERDGLFALVEKVSSQRGFLDKYLTTQKSKVGKFRIPKFKISFGFEASKVLKRMGLALPFSDKGGGFSKMVESHKGKKLFVSNIFHKSFIEVNEKGTIATAVSSYVMMEKSCSIPMNFVADHPFLFLIRDEVSRVVLFIGHLLDPSQEIVNPHSENVWSRCFSCL